MVASVEQRLWRRRLIVGDGGVEKGGHRSVDFNIIMQTASHYITFDCITLQQQQEQNIASIHGDAWRGVIFKLLVPPS
jgi:hypothetical protein